MKTFAGSSRSAMIAICLLGVIGLAGLRPALDYLGDARIRHAELEAETTRQPPVLPALPPHGEMIEVGDRRLASQAIVSMLRKLAVREGVLVEMLKPASDTPPNIVAVDIKVSGASDHVLRFAEAVENHSPVTRFAYWNVAIVGDHLLLDARAAGLWNRAL